MTNLPQIGVVTVPIFARLDGKEFEIGTLDIPIHGGPANSVSD